MFQDGSIWVYFCMPFATSLKGLGKSGCYSDFLDERKISRSESVWCTSRITMQEQMSTSQQWKWELKNHEIGTEYPKVRLKWVVFSDPSLKHTLSSLELLVNMVHSTESVQGFDEHKVTAKVPFFFPFELASRI